MMALRDLLDALDAELQAEQQAEADGRAADAERILADASRHAQRETDRIAAEFAAAAEQEAALITSDARADARRTITAARRTALDAVRAAVEHRLARLPGTATGAQVAAACTEEALAALPGAVRPSGREPSARGLSAREPSATRLSLHPADRISLPAGVQPGPPLDDGGAIAVAADGFVDNTLPTRLANRWPQLQIDLVKRWDADP